MDVEVSVEGDSLTVGVFGPAQMLGQTGVAAVIERITGLLGAVV